jgi:predicted acetyltransferase
MIEGLRLETPAAGLVRSYVELLDEMAAAGEKVWPARPEPGESDEAFAARIVKTEAVRVPQTTCWATVGEMVVGRIVLRHRLNAELAEFGGHVSYEVRPSWRRRGVAGEMVRRILETAQAREIGRLLLTCAPDNVASNRTIQAAGGVLERTIYVERIGRETNLYWITL